MAFGTFGNAFPRDPGYGGTHPKGRSVNYSSIPSISQVKGFFAPFLPLEFFPPIGVE